MLERTFGDKKHYNSYSNLLKIAKNPVNPVRTDLLHYRENTTTPAMISMANINKNQRSNGVKILLFSKKLLPFSRVSISFLAVLAIFLFFHPLEAKAGFFDYFCFWCKGNTRSTAFINEINAFSPPDNSEPVLSSFSPPSGPIKNSADTPLSIIENSTLVPHTNPQGIMRDGIGGGEDTIFVYEVQPGDTPSGIASSFGVSVNTILWANDITNPNRIKIGDKLIILPVSGVKHEIKKGDTISGIAKQYGGNSSDILAFNGLSSNEDLVVGEIIIIPDGEISGLVAAVPSSGVSSSASSKLQELKGFFMRPILNAVRSRGLHGKNGVDLINSDTSGNRCGPKNVPVFASAEGTVLLVKSSGWNGGYGKYVVISHPDKGVQTLYAHLKMILTFAGQKVSQGETIGYVGSSGNSTGCHVHFEVRGAKNPF